MLDNQWANSLASVLIMITLIQYRQSLTPQFLFFATSMVHEETEFLFVTAGWLLWKNFLVVPHGPMLSISRLAEERLKVVLRSLFELILALTLAQALLNYFEGGYPWVYCLGLFGFAGARSIYFEHMDLPCFLFMILYLSQNLLVNSIDFVLYKSYLEHYNDEQFLKMFSFKVY
mmetsp:Transcript_1301/g.1622  ORF Transcript_1301/g.1622 Transcript_1301/m.1622 type:complete len:174 (+) Transcript_1301:574-1095(+)